MIRAIKFATEHFLVLSAAVTAFGAALSLLFLTGYLVAFDSQLIWIIETADIFKFTIIAFSLIFASIAFIGALSDLVKIMSFEGKSKYYIFALLIIFIVATYLYGAYQELNNNNKLALTYKLISMMFSLSTLTLITMCIDYWRQIRDEQRLTVKQNVAIFTFLVISINLLGLSYGFQVKSDKSFEREVHLKDKSNAESIVKNAKVILLLSHHTVLLSNNQLSIIPSVDIVKISSDIK